jgi:hypothetical protein
MEGGALKTICSVLLIHIATSASYWEWKYAETQRRNTEPVRINRY